MPKLKPRPVPSNASADAHAFAHTLGLTIVTHRDSAVDGWWLMRDLIGRDGKTLIIFREADRTYSIDGYEPWHDGMFGGRYPEVMSALLWVERARAIRAGTETNFLGR